MPEILVSKWPDWKIRNLILGVMFFVWGVAHLVQSPADTQWTVPVLGAVLLQLTVAWLIANRAVAVAEGGLVDIGVASVSLISGAVLLTMLPQRPQDWNWVSLVLIAVGSFVAIMALMHLGRSFAIFPARRKLITNGLYRWIRHPAYAGEMMIMVGVTHAAGTNLAWILMMVTLAGVVGRIDREERLLAVDEGHQCYRQQVRWRLVPKIW